VASVASRAWAPRDAALTAQVCSQAVPVRSQAVPVLQVFAAALMVFPSYYVIKPLGADGYAAGIVGMFAFAFWGVATLLGIHDAQSRRHPVRGVLCFLWLTALVSYVLMDRGTLSTLQNQSADRFLMQLADMTGIALIAAECLNSLHDVRRVLRALTWGGAFCGGVAALQFWLSLNLTTSLKLPGFSIDAIASAISTRNGLARVTGTAIHPIELGVVAAMLLPLAIYLVIYDTERKAWKRWTPVVLIAIAVPASVSRSAILAVALSIGVLIVLMPIRHRLMALAALPVSLAAVFMTSHGLIRTMIAYFGMGSADPSVAHRLNNWSYVEQMVREAPWFGHGGGTFIPSTVYSTLHVLDDQYLHTAIELGLVGVVALGALFILPMIAALVARRRSSDPELQLLCAALAGGVLAATVCSATFDSLSFPMFYNVYALVIGLIGASWRLAARDQGQTTDAGPSRSFGTNLASGKLALTSVRIRALGG
jgi:O-antigen ligase